MAVDDGVDVRNKITVGVCVMEKKVKCGSEVFVFYLLWLVISSFCLFVCF